MQASAGWRRSDSSSFFSDCYLALHLPWRSANPRGMPWLPAVIAPMIRALDWGGVSHATGSSGIRCITIYS